MHIVKGYYVMWRRHKDEEPNGGGGEEGIRDTLKTEGAAVGVMLYQIGSGRSRPGFVRRISI